MKKLGFLFGCIFTSILLAWCCKCPCSEKIESMDEPEFEINDFDSVITAFYNWWSFTCNFSWDIEDGFMDGYVAVGWDRMSAHANWETKDSSWDLLMWEWNVIIKNWLLFEWGTEYDELEGEVDEWWMGDIVELLDDLKETIEDPIDWTWTTFNIDCKSWIEESDFIVPSGINFYY